MNLIQIVKEKSVCEVEEIIKQELQKNPNDIQLWFRLSMVELQFPFEDFFAALKCIDKVYELSECNVTALILETGIKWHAKGFVEEEMFHKIKEVKSKDRREMAIFKFFQALYYEGKKEYAKQKKCLEQSIALCDEFVYPYKALGYLMQDESKENVAKEMFERALLNVKKVYRDNEFHDYTDINEYIQEYITGTALSDINYKHIRKLALEEV